ncbi:MAG: hypothetical protein K2W91_00525 [Novosphingobium sp.]|nr:hypothetical protein [Novosphingobium sp.]
MRFKAAWACVAIVFSAPAIAKTYNNEVFGIAIERPDKWQTISAAEAKGNAGTVETDSSVLEAALAEFERASLFVFMKHPISRPGVNPTLKLSVHSAKGAEALSDVQIAGLLAKQMESVFPDFELVEAPASAAIGNTNGARFVVRFTLTAGGGTYRVKSRAWVIKRGKYFINLATSFENDTDGAELAQVANTLALRN